MTGQLSLIALTAVATWLMLSTGSTGEQLAIERLDQESSHQAGASGLLNWDAYTKLFNKQYSSLAQQLARQKLFMAKVLLVFKRAALYRLGLVSSYFAINRYSDLTRAEELELMTGEQLDETRPLNDEQVSALLASVPRLSSSSSIKLKARARRSAGAEALGPIRRVRQIDLLDLIQSPAERASNYAHLNVAKIVPSSNPHYQRLETPSQGLFSSIGSLFSRQPRDIPDKQMESIEKSGAGQASSDEIESNAEKFNQIVRETSSSTRELIGQKEDLLQLDWRRSGCIAPPMDQGPCAACYAISSMSYVEWAFCMHKNKTLTPLSAQYFVSCGPQFMRESSNMYQFLGCRTGRTRHFIHFVREYGVELEANMPFQAIDYDCPIEENTPKELKGYIRPEAKDLIRMYPLTKNLDNALDRGPLLVVFTMNENFLAHAGGMIDSCSSDVTYGHAMLVVGKGVQEGEDYLLIKNSMGLDWGEQGYFKLKRKALSDCVKEFMMPALSF